MIFSYAARLVLLSLASFFFLQLFAGLATALLAPTLIRFAERLRSWRAARLLLAARLFPAGFAAAAVVGLCAPSYLLYEPTAVREQLAGFGLAAALLGFATCALSAARGCRALIRSARFVRR